MGRQRLLLTLVVALLSAACSILGISVERAPYLLLSIKVVSGEGPTYNIGVLSVEFLNRADKPVTSLELEFDLYDTEGSPQPQIGSNHVSSVLENTILPSESLELEVVVDGMFTTVPDTTLTATRLCITGITYSDGSRWEDPLRLNTVMGDSIDTEKL